MRVTPTVVALAAAVSLTLVGCGSGDDSATSSAAESPTGAATEATTCPTEAPAGDAASDWDFTGQTGSVAVVGPTDSTAPRIDVQTPFAVAETTVQTLQAGDGVVIPETAAVSVCYEGVNGRTGDVFDSSFASGAPVQFPLGGVVNGFRLAIAGQTVGSTVAVAMTSADGYPNGMPAAGIEAGDSLIFAIHILDAAVPAN